jgi:acyl dehydratase
MTGSATEFGSREATDDKRFEDFAVGQTIVSPGRTVEAADINAFAGLTGDFYPLHVDEEHARQTRFGGRIAHGPLTFSIAVGLVGLSGFYGDAVEALLGVDELRAHQPVRPGDTLRVHVTVTATEPARNPGFGNVHLAYSVRNQAAEEVMTFKFSVLARRRRPLEHADGG